MKNKTKSFIFTLIAGLLIGLYAGSIWGLVLGIGILFAFMAYHYGIKGYFVVMKSD